MSLYVPIIPGKSSWPELVGVSEKQAVKAIAQDRPDLDVEVVRPNMVVTPVVNQNRVRVWVDNNDVVSHVPIIG